MNSLLAQTDLTTTSSSTNGGVIAAVSVISIVLIVITLAALWKIFVKLGEPGWKGLIPIYNWVVILNKNGQSGFLVLLAFVPCVGQFILAWLIASALGDEFGKSTGYKIGLFLLPGIFHLMLGFGSSEAVGIKGGSSPAPMA